jgi:hypothetical protein
MSDILLNKLFFTKKDEDISGTAQRDPLGLQPIWSFYGRQVINHLTTISTSIHGFREVLLCLSICNEINGTKKDLSYSDLILLFEQLFIYTSISKGKVEGILGADNGYAKFNAYNKNPEISLKQTILVREISLGYYGRYKSPLSTMGIIDSRSELLIDKEEIKNHYGGSRYNKILVAFKNFVFSNKKFINFTAKDELYEAVFGKFREAECNFWLNRLYEVDGETKELMKKCYSLANKDIIPGDSFYKLKSFNEVENIIKLEPFLRCLEEVFFKVMSSKDISYIKINNIKEHKKRYDEFCKISNYSDSQLFNVRIKYLKENCSPDSENYIKNIIKYHELVCRQKKSSVWVDLDTVGRLKSFVNVNDVAIDINQWGRDYYFSSLQSVKAEIEEFSK